MGKQPIRVRRTFTPQFKKDAVRLVTAEGKSVNEIATHLGIARSLLQRWKEQLAGAPTEAFPGHGKLAPQPQRIRDLEQKLREVTQERDILKSVGLLCGRPEVKFQFVDQHRATFPVGQLCRVLEVSRSGFYAWRHRPRSDRDHQNAALVTHIQRVHQESRGIYGSPRVYHALRAGGHGVGKHRVSRLMRLEGLRGRAARRFRFIATARSADLPAAPNRVRRHFHAAALNRLWLADITQVRTREGWLFLATLLDACSRRIVGWATSPRPEQALALEALRAAIPQRHPPAGLLHHRDRGGQYASADCQDLLDQHGIVCSMSRPGNCLDNAPAESFFHSLKTQWLYHFTFSSRARRRWPVVGSR